MTNDGELAFAVTHPSSHVEKKYRVTITPDIDCNVNLIFPVIVNDGTDNSNTYDLTVTVTAVNDAPVISDQSTLSTPEQTGLTIVLTDLTVSDVDNSYPADFNHKKCHKANPKTSGGCQNYWQRKFLRDNFIKSTR